MVDNSLLAFAIMLIAYLVISIGTVLVVGLIVGFSFLLGQTAGLAQRLGDDPLQLAVGGTELVGCPLLNGIHRVAVDTQDKTLGGFLCHSLLGSVVSSVFSFQFSVVSGIRINLTTEN